MALKSAPKVAPFPFLLCQLKISWYGCALCNFSWRTVMSNSLGEIPSRLPTHFQQCTNLSNRFSRSKYIRLGGNLSFTRTSVMKRSSRCELSRLLEYFFIHTAMLAMPIVLSCSLSRTKLAALPWLTTQLLRIVKVSKSTSWSKSMSNALHSRCRVSDNWRLMSARNLRCSDVWASRITSPWEESALMISLSLS